jgi:hypothetical protein
MCYIDGQKNKYSVLNECNRMLKYNTVIKLMKPGLSIFYPRNRKACVEKNENVMKLSKTKMHRTCNRNYVENHKY